MKERLAAQTLRMGAALKRHFAAISWTQDWGLVGAVIVLMLAPILKVYIFNAGEFEIGLMQVLVAFGGLAVLAGLAAFLILKICGLAAAGKYALYGASAAIVLVLFFVAQPNKEVDTDIVDSVVWQHWLLGGLCATAAGLAVWSWALDKRRILDAMQLGFLFAAIYVTLFAVYGLFTVNLYTAMGSDETPPIDAIPVSKDRNVILILIDTAQASFFDWHMKKHPELAGAFEGFVQFDDTMTIAPHTSYSLASVLSGSATDRDLLSRPNELLSVEREDSVFRLSQDAGFEPHIVSSYYAANECSICYKLRDFPVRRSELWLRDYVSIAVAAGDAVTGLARTFDALAKVTMSFLGFNGGNFGYVAIRHDMDILQSVTDLLTPVETPVFQFQHYLSLHPPIKYDANCNTYAFRARGSLRFIEAEHVCVFSQIAAFLERLKALNAYDNSLIIIFGDHGYTIRANTSQALGRAGLLFPGAEVIGEGDFRPAGRYNPMLIMKDFGARGPLQPDARLSMLVDITATLCEVFDQEDACGDRVEGISLRQPVPDDRQRPFWRYFGTQAGRYKGETDRYRGGLGPWWVQQSLRGPIVPNLPDSLRVPIAELVPDPDRPLNLDGE